MKRILYLLTFTLLYIPSFAQQVNDALLLDYYQNQRYVEAFNYLKSVYLEPVNDIKALSRLAYISQKAGKLPDAKAYYLRMYNLDSTNTAVLYNLASVNQMRGNYNEAEIYYKKILVTDTNDFQVYKQLAGIRLAKLDTVGQLNYLQKANKLNPTEFDVASDLSEIYIAQKKYLPAERVLNIALAADPENRILLRSQLQLAYNQSKWPQVIKIGEQLLALGDESERIRLGIGYFRTKNYTCGLETLMAISKDSQNETSYYFIAACYKQLNNFKVAVTFFKKAIKLSLSPTTATAYGEMADSYEKMGQLQTAESTYKKSLLYEDRMPLTYYSLAILYDTKLKDKKNALTYYKKYLASKPGEQDKEYIDYSNNRITALSVH